MITKARNAWTEIALGRVLHRRRQELQIEETDSYKRVTIRLNGQGVVLRNEAIGAEIGTKHQFVIRSGQFILSKIDARNGAFGVVPPECDGAIITGNFWTFDVEPERLDARYFYYLTGTPLFVDFCVRASEGTTNRRYLQEDRFLAQTLSLPPLTEQRRIVAKIERLAAKIDEAHGLRTRCLAETDATLHSAFRSAIVNTNGAPTVPLEDICCDIIDCLHSNPVYANTGIPTLRSPDVGWGKLLLHNARKTSQKEYERRTQRGEPQAGDIILVREGGGTGKAGIVETGQRVSLGQRVMQLRPDETKVLPRFLLFQWLSPLIQQDQIAMRMKGSASPHLNIGALRKFAFVLPPVSEQRRIVAYLDGLQAKVDKLKRLQAETAAELDALLPAILDRAFKGQL